MRLRNERRAMPGLHRGEFEEFAARDGRRLLGFALLLTGDRQDAEDLVQTALLRSASRWSSARRQPEGYTRAVLVNLARDRWRISRRSYRAEPLAEEWPAAGGDIEVVTLATGAVRTWGSARPGRPEQLSWASNGRDLGFFWTDGAEPGTSASGLWVLDTAARSRNLMSGRRILPAYAGTDQVQTALLSPDGATVIASVTYDGTGQVAAGTVVGGIVELSARTGRPLRTLLAEHAAYAADPRQPGWYVTTCQLPAIDASSEHLLVSCDRFGRLDRARFTALPGSAPQLTVAAAW